MGMLKAINMLKLSVGNKDKKTPLNVYKGLIAPIKTDSLIDARFFHVY